MSQRPKVYHGPEVKCGGYGMCSQCTERINNQAILDIKALDPEKLRKTFPPQKPEILATMKPSCCRCYDPNPNGSNSCKCHCHDRF